MAEVTTAFADEIIRLQWELREREATITIQTEALARLREALEELREWGEDAVYHVQEIVDRVLGPEEEPNA